MVSLKYPTKLQTVIDFDQLQIENKQYQTRIEERNGELLKLKKSAGNTVQILNFHKKKLASLTKESFKLLSEINSRKDLLSRLVSEAGSVAVEREAAKEFNASLRNDIGEYRVPHVMDYVEVKVGVGVNGEG
jgi:chromosome segregation ATPase